MNKRRILYGYVIHNGELAIEPKEAEIVRQIFADYSASLSYQGIADKLNSKEVPFSDGAPEWNKHKVKRLLEDCRYIGEREYPPIIPPEIFEEVQLTIKSKSPSRKKVASNCGIKTQTTVIPIETVYTPSTEVVQIENAINRALEQPDKPAYIWETILQGITVRYKCIKDKEMIN